ncbi:enoyl-CoA hydratase-related protein [Pseudorhodoferax sp.]|uniref:enoyl-CoA hydratase-related protein n=1 Tax=Pseudorhodoferax sp. TaxID=1993553 RepID=UPI002DD6403F|nr:enoyl-CoA hydratase-related protein [Pseudorhodoferax sp.]
MSATVQEHFAAGVLLLRMHRPERRNAMNAAMYSALADAFSRAADDHAVRAVVLAGSADCFTSGNDLTEPPDGLDGPLGRFIQAVMDCEKPLLAAPCGLAIGIGLTLLPYCDLVVCGERTSFQAPFVRLGVCPELGSSYMLTRLMGHQRAAAVLLTGEAFDAAAAQQAGLVWQVVPNAQAEAVAVAAAERMARLPPRAVRATKALMRRWSHATAHEANRVEMDLLVQLGAGPEAQEAVAAFLAKRAPDFSRFD